MWRVFYGENCIYDPRSDTLTLTDESGTLNAVDACTFTFTMPPTHPYYDKIECLQKAVEIIVKRDDDVVFQGRAISKEYDWDNNITYTCESERSYLNDVLLPPYTTAYGDMDDNEKEYTELAPNTLSALFDWYVMRYNKAVPSEQAFYVGQNEADSLLTYERKIYRASTERATVWNEIKEKILDYYGGVIRVRHEGTMRYIDMLTDEGKVSAQTIEFGKNLTDYTRTKDFDEFATRIKPTCEFTGDTGATRKVMLTSATDGELTSDGIYKAKDYVGYTKLEEQYGIVDKEVDYGTVSVSTNTMPFDTYFQDRLILYYCGGEDSNTPDAPNGNVTNTTNDYWVWTRTVPAYLDVSKNYWCCLQYKKKGKDEWLHTDPVKIEVLSYESDKGQGRVDGMVFATVYNGSDTPDLPTSPVTYSGTGYNQWSWSVTDWSSEYTDLYCSFQMLRDGEYSWTSAAKFEDVISFYQETSEAIQYKEAQNQMLYDAVADLKVMAVGDTLELTAVDLHQMDADVEAITIGSYVLVKSKPHGISSYFLCTSIDFSATDPGANTYSFGTDQGTLTNQQRAKLTSLNLSITNTVTQLSENIDKTSAEMADVAKETQEKADNALKISDEAKKNAIDATDEAAKATEIAKDANVKSDQANKDAQDAIDRAKAAADEAANASQTADAATAKVTLVEEQYKTVTENVEKAQKDADDALAKYEEAAKQIGGVQSDVEQVKKYSEGISDKADSIRNELLDDIKTVTETMEADYAKTTDLSNTEVNLKSEISKSAGEIRSEVSSNYVSNTQLETNNGNLRNEVATQFSANSEIKQLSDRISQTVKSVEKLTINVGATSDRVTQAQTALDAANTSLYSAYDELDKAENALWNLKNNPNATEAQIKAAQDAVNQAQNSVNTAQSYKDTCEKELAAAKDALESLENRVSNAETAIDQSDKAIALRATKTELTSAIEDAELHAKSYTDASLTVTAGDITQSVSEWIVGHNNSISNINTTVSTQAGKISDLISNEAKYQLKELPDTRNDNKNPQWYMDNYPRQIVTEFKNTSVIGLSGETFCPMTTVVPWNDSTGGYPRQETFIAGKTYNRHGTSGTAWSDWSSAATTSELDSYASNERVETLEKSVSTIQSGTAMMYNYSGCSGDGKHWTHVGDWESWDSASININIYSGSGYNGSASQNSTIGIFIKDGWQSTPSTSTAFGYTVALDQCTTDNVKVKVLATAHNKCEVWVYLSWDYANGYYGVTKTPGSTWTDVSAKQSAEPSGVEQNAGYAEGIINLSAKWTQQTQTNKDFTNAINSLENGKVSTTLVRSYADGVEVAKTEDGVYTGTRTLTSTDGLYIKDKDNNVLASYKSTEINLGANSTDSVIKICGGKGQFAYHIPEGVSKEAMVVSAPNMRITDDQSSSSGRGYFDLRRNDNGSYSVILYSRLTDSSNASGILEVHPNGITLGCRGSLYLYGSSIQLGEYTLSDYVIDQGTSGSWYYRRWYSGICEAWYRVAQNCSASTWTTLTISYPFTIYNAIVQVSRGSNSSAYSNTINLYTATTNSAVSMEFHQTAAGTPYFNFYVKGTWK